MFDFFQFFSSIGGQLTLLLMGVVFGAIFASLYLSAQHRQQLLLAKEDVFAVREQLASATGQLEQLQRSDSEKVSLLKETRVQLGQDFENLAHRIFDGKQQQFDQQNAKTLSHNLGPLKNQIDEFKQQVASVYEKENAERNKLIGKIDELQQQTQKIGEDAVNLALALKGDNKTQGNWGEVVLERLLEESGLQKGQNYETQVALVDEDGKRRNPDVVIYLPDNKQLIIDAKVSLRHYERYLQSDDEQEKAVALKQHIQSVRQHIKTLSHKSYEHLQGVKTLDFVFIFMPVEAAFMLALQHEPALFKEAYDKQIVLVSPTTLMATLRTVSNLWRYENQHNNAEEIATQAGRLYDQFALVIESLDQLGKQLHKTQEQYDKTYSRLKTGRGNLMTRVENLKKLGAKTKKILPVDEYSDDELLGHDQSVKEEEV